MRHCGEFLNRYVLVLIGHQKDCAIIDGTSNDEGFEILEERLKRLELQVQAPAPTLLTSRTVLLPYGKAKTPNANRPYDSAGLCTIVIQSAALAGIWPRWVGLADTRRISLVLLRRSLANRTL